MIKTVLGVVLLFGVSIFACPVMAEEACKTGKTEYKFTPDSSTSYQKISEGQARTINNKGVSGQVKFSVQTESGAENTSDKDAQN